MTVRRETTADAPAVRVVGHAARPLTSTSLRGAAYVGDGLSRRWSTEQVSRGITDRVTDVAEVGDAIVGCAVVGSNDDAPMLWKLYVVPTAQRSGVGRALLDGVVRMERRLR